MTGHNTDIEFINSHPEIHLTPAKKRIQGRPSYVCPLCGNGTGASGTGLTTKDGKHWHCFKCGFHGDVITLIAKEQGIADGGSRAALAAARAVYGIVRDKIPTEPAQRRPPARKEPLSKNESEKTTTPDYIAFIKAHCTEDADTSFLEARGLSPDTVLRLHFGYCPDHQTIVIPISTGAGWQYIERYARTRNDGQRYHIPKGARAGIFNKAVLRQTEPVFITEGAITAASIEEVGGRALALNSASNAGAFVRLLKEITPRPRRFIIAMDNDEAGASAADTLLKGMTELGIDCTIYEVDQQYNDCNDWLISDRKKFQASIEEAKKI